MHNWPARTIRQIYLHEQTSIISPVISKRDSHILQQRDRCNLVSTFYNSPTVNTAFDNKLGFHPRARFMLKSRGQITEQLNQTNKETVLCYPISFFELMIFYLIYLALFSLRYYFYYTDFTTVIHE